MIMEKPIFIAAALAVAVGSSAVAAAAAVPDTVAVETPVYYVPTAVAMPVMVDSTDVSAKSFDAGSLLRSMPRLDAMAPGVDAPARDWLLYTSPGPRDKQKFRMPAFG